MILDLQQFIRVERPFWDELAALLKRIEDDPDLRLGLDETRRFHYLYDRAAADLLRISTFASSPEVSYHLEALVARAYGEIHETRAPRRHFFFLHWFTRDFPRTFRRHLRAFGCSLGLTILGAAFGAGVLYMDPDAKETLLPFPELMQKPSERVAHEEKEKGKELEGHKASFAGFLMTHNIRVSIFTFAMGMTYGIGTALMLFYNGVMIGAISLDYIQDGQTSFLIGWLLPHGSIEIPSILIAGQAGFVLASALIGSRKRLSLLRRLEAVRSDLVTLIGGFSVLLVWAGTVESFFSQYHEPVLPYGVKIGFGMIELMLLITYLSFSGRKKYPDEVAP
ncbi:MAG TPA: stage II sporulation protein M [Candidatus Methylacidiphilales bacterium]|nr:stage II sporulation protein M [Candidatus Methylacidiphilales bacterium]